MKRRGQAFLRINACRFPRRWKSFRGVLFRWHVPHVLITLLCHLVQAELLKNMLGWSQLEKTDVPVRMRMGKDRSGVWLFRGALQGENLFTCVGLAMVTFLSWMANAKTSSCIVRIPVGNKNGSTLRSVGSNNMFPPVLRLGLE